jgi:hypothetical protein
VNHTPSRNGSGAPHGAPLTLAQRIEAEAGAFAIDGTPAGRFIAHHLRDLARRVQFVGGDTTAEVQDRLDTLERDFLATRSRPSSN